MSSSVRLYSGMLALVSTLLGAIGTAQAADLQFDRLAPGTIKLDGKPKEWPEGASFSETVKPGSTTGTAHVGYDETGIFVGVEVLKPGAFARTSAFGPNEDCVSLIVAFPKEGSREFSTTEIGLYAGVVAVSAGSVRVRSTGKEVPGAKILESTIKGGYALEAFIPWSALPESKRVRAGLRGALRIYDGDGSSIRAIKSTSSGSAESPSTLGFLLNQAEQALPAALAGERKTLRDVIELHADVTGDGTLERILLTERTLYVMGPTIREGKQFLSQGIGMDVIAAETRDITGDGKAELLLTTRGRAPSGALRDAFVAYNFQGDKPVRVLTHESSITLGGNVLRDTWTLGTGSKPTVTFNYAAPKGFEPTSYKEPIASDVDPILLPWGSVKERKFAWTGSSFAMVGEVPQKAVVLEVPKLAPTTAAPATPIPTGDPARVALDNFRKEKGLGKDTPPKSELVINHGTSKTRVALFNRDLVVTRPTGAYSYVTMTRFSTDKDILEIVAKDLTGDGFDDVIVRGVVRAKMTGPAGEREVLREVLVVYVVRETSLQSAFNAETARQMGDGRVESNFKLLPGVGGKGGSIEFRRGSAKSWTEKTYPFSSETGGSGVEPMLLPWAKEELVTYRWLGDRFSR